MTLWRRLLVVGLVVGARAEEWMFLDAYPHQLDALPCDAIAIDGVLDEPCWRAAAWSGGFEDIAQPLHPGASIPAAYQTSVAVAYDADAVYVAAVLRETMGWATISGDNGNLTDHRAPWWNQDFEVFLDASRTTHDYVEFETNALNATYDVLWRVPQAGFDSLGVPCAPGEFWCQNSTFNGGNQTWTLKPTLASATVGDRAFDPLDGAPRGDWTVELRFPLRGARGGLLANARSRAPADGVFWSANFARAEHPLPRDGPAGLSLDFSSPEYAAFCADVQRRHPTLLGTDQWSCYWEWVWQNMAATRYMHNPDLWGVLRFAERSAAAPCRDPDFPIRHVLFNAQRAMISHYLARATYPTSLEELVACGPVCCNATTSFDPAALAVALATPSVFNVTVDDLPGSCVDYARFTTTGAPCFAVVVDFRNPRTGHAATGSTREDRFTVVDASAATPCL